MPRNRGKTKDGPEKSDAPRAGSASGGRRNRGKKGREEDFIDEEVTDLILKIGENDNTTQSRQSQFREEALVKFLQKNVEELYPNIGKETYRVPDVHINKGKPGETIEEGVSGFSVPQETDSRSDRAHNFVSEMVFHLSTKMKHTSVGPFFIISSYDYDHYLSRLKTSIEKKLKAKEKANETTNLNLPKDTGHERGEVDIMIVLPKHVIFVEIKAIGDNFADYTSNKVDVSKTNIRKAVSQLVRDEEVFNHIMKDLELKDFRLTKVVAVPNLEKSYVEGALEDPDMKKDCKNLKFLCKEDMPKSYHNFHHDFHVFQDWWITNVFKEEQKPMAHAAGSPEEEIRNAALKEVKIIVGRYVGFMSVVQVCNTSNSSSRRIEVRRKGQSVGDVGRRFAEIVLTKDQKSYLDENIRLGYLCGPPGSGKTVVLAVKARRWIMNDGNYVVVVNMYRGAEGRAIGKQIYRTITKNPNEEKEKFLKSHCMEIGVDVSAFNKEAFLRVVCSRPGWEDAIKDKGRRIMFIVDETYVQSYWESVFQTLRQEFEDSGLWCAGLYGKQPEGFKSMELKLVIRCPPTVQEVLRLIDWDPNRLGCYITDGTTACLPTNGPHVLTVRHQRHGEFASHPPSQCRICGEELAQVLEDLSVEKPACGHQAADLKLFSLKCSDILFLVNMPRSNYRCDENNFLDTTEQDYKNYMANYNNCQMLETLREAGYPYRVHNQLSCPDLISPDVKQVINVTWIYTYQGLENKIIVFIPGDEAMPENRENLEDYLTNPYKNIPCPGLQGGGGKGACVQRDSSREESDEDSSSSVEENTKSEIEHNGAATDGPAESGLRRKSSEGATSPKKVCEAFPQALVGEDGKRKERRHSKEEQIFLKDDINRYSRWDQNNLFISASRCTSQLILITR